MSAYDVLTGPTPDWFWPIAGLWLAFLVASVVARNARNARVERHNAEIREIVRSIERDNPWNRSR